jgi:hypothetical protein
MSKSRARHRAGQRSDVRWLVGGIAGLESREEDEGQVFEIKLQLSQQVRSLMVCVSCYLLTAHYVLMRGLTPEMRDLANRVIYGK